MLDLTVPLRGEVPGQQLLDLAKLQVVNLIPYANDDAFDVVPDGYQAAADTAADDKNNDDDIPF